MTTRETGITTDASIVDHIARLVQEERRLHDKAQAASEGRARLEAIASSSMSAGSVVGVLIGGLLLGVLPDAVLLPLLIALLLASAVKVWRHRLR